MKSETVVQTFERSSIFDLIRWRLTANSWNSHSWSKRRARGWISSGSDMFFFTVYLVDLHCITLYHNVHCTCLLMFMVLYWTCTTYKPAPQYLVSWLANWHSRVICSTILLNRSQSQRCSQSSKQPNAGHAGQDSRPQAKAEVEFKFTITLTHTHKTKNVTTLI